MHPISEIESRFAKLANPEKAIAMQNYMKNQFPFLGIAAPERKQVFKELYPILKLLSVDDKWKLVHDLWGKEEREFQYIAIELILRFKKNEWKEADIQKIEHLLITKSWWDSVDLIASYACSSLAHVFPQLFKETTLKWTRSNNIWLQRSTLLFQLKWKRETDLKVLSQQIGVLKENNTFFIQKAIGWCLREYAKTNPEWVLQEVEKQKLTGLAKREALKHLTN